MRGHNTQGRFNDALGNGGSAELSKYRVLKQPVLPIGGKQQVGPHPDEEYRDADDHGFQAAGGAQLNHMAREAEQNARQQQIAGQKFDIGRKRKVFLQREKSDKDGERQDVRYG